MVKVRKKKAGESIGDISLLIETSDEILQWDDDDLVKSIMEEVEIAENTARQIAIKVRTKIKEVAETMNWETVPTSLIREFVSNEIIAGGKRYNKKATKYNELGLSAKELKTIIEGVGAGENSNISAHNPEAINFNIAEVVSRKYAFQEVFSPDLVKAHMDGKIHLHDTGQIFKFYAFSKFFRVKVRIDGEEEEISLIDLWDDIEKPTFVLNETQIEKDISHLGIEIFDRGEYVPLERLVYSSETKEMVDFSIKDDGTGNISVTEGHGCIIKRDGQLMIIRADEVVITDEFISCAEGSN